MPDTDNAAPAIRFDDVYRRFADTEVLRGLSFEVKRGEIFALLGRNGEGKTTALRIALGLLRAHHGAVTVNGVDSTELTGPDRMRIAYVSEGHTLYKSMRIGEALAFESATRADFRRDYALDALAQCKLATKRLIATLSRGQRAQLALILAVAGTPDVLIFDDPALGLDAVMRRAFLDALIDVLSDRGCAVLFSSHILTDVERVADRVGILSAGRLIVNATMDDIKRRVERRFLFGALPTDVPGVVAARTRGGSHEVTLVDPTDATYTALTADGGKLSEPTSVTLEDFFLDITTGGSEGILPVRKEAAA